MAHTTVKKKEKTKLVYNQVGASAEANMRFYYEGRPYIFSSVRPDIELTNPKKIKAFLKSGYFKVVDVSK